MALTARLKLSGVVAATLAMAFSLFASAGAAIADEPDPPVLVPFNAPACAGETLFDPTQNTGFAVLDLTEVFGDRLTSYNEGHIVPLYDAFGGSVLLTDEGVVTEETAYPPLCGTRYVASEGTAVSEWMFCTDRLAQTCGDTDAEGRLIDQDGNPINPMTGLDVNPKLTPDQEKLIAFLIQNGHSYQGVGDQRWGDVTEARSDLGSYERAALQTLVWCISDPATGDSDFATTCENNMGAEEQERLLMMIPDVPELTVALTSSDESIDVDEVAEFTLTTNVFNQPIQIATAGGAGAVLSVCGGDATLDGATLTVNSSDPNVLTDIALCATATTAGTMTLTANATPPSTSHIGWSQSANETLAQPCQVYATFHETQAVAVDARAEIVFATAPAPTPSPSPDTPEPTSTPTSTPTVSPTTPAQNDASLAATGGSVNLAPLWVGLGLVVVGGAAAVFGIRRRRHDH